MSGMKEMEIEEPNDGKEAERSKRPFRGLVTACGYDSSRQGRLCACVCVCVSRKKACESSAEGKLKSITLVKD